MKINSDLFHATRGRYIPTDGFIIGMEIYTKDCKIKAIEKDKAHCLEMAKLSVESEKILGTNLHPINL